MVKKRIKRSDHGFYLIEHNNKQLHRKYQSKKEKESKRSLGNMGKRGERESKW